MDTIQKGWRIICKPPGTESVPHYSRGTEARNLLHQITSLVEVYNARLRRLSLAEKASNNLTTIHLHAKHGGMITIIHHDSLAWASGLAPVPAAQAPTIKADRWHARRLNPASRAELRAYFIRKGGSKREAWRRFPPATAEEHAQMAKDLAMPQKQKKDPMEAIIRAAARKRGADPNDPAFRAKIIREQEELARLIEEI